MIATEPFSNPIRWADIDPVEFTAIHLTGGHAPGMKQYLEAKVLQDKLCAFAKLDRTLSSICHGSLLLARSVDPDTGQSLVYNKRFTTLPHWMEDIAWNVTRLTMDKHYRTYEMYCEDEVRSFQSTNQQYQVGPTSLTACTAYSGDGAFVVEDVGVVSARWPGDAYLLARKTIEAIWKRGT